MTRIGGLGQGDSRGWRDNAPIFSLDHDAEKEYPNGDKLPSIYITVPVADDEGDVIGRNCVMLYPCPYPDLAPEDVDGEDALYYGGCYYDEAMSYTSPDDHEKRVDCFRAAELLYRHSAGRGNAVANLCLGYVYSYDRCEGNYYIDPLSHWTDENEWKPIDYPREERAFECLSIAARARIPEACYKLGDMYKHGTGCSPDASEAFRWYVRAAELSARERPVILGSVALRLADCYEEGFGCPHDFEQALEWYRKAVVGLEVAVEAGETWYAKALASARAGVKRCEQEVGAS